MANKQYITAREIMEIWGVKSTKAYSLIRAANNELMEKGCYVVAGKAPRRFVLKKLGLDDDDVAETETRREDVPRYGEVTREVTPENG